MKKKLLILSAALLNSLCFAQSVSLTWDASPTTNVTYRLYAHTNDLTQLSNLLESSVRISVGTNRLVTATNIMAGTWYFGVTSVNTNGIESVLSNMVITEVPIAPQNLRTVVVQWSGQIASTNWIDAIFLKLKIGN